MNVAIIQARVGSTRFPRKVLADLAGRELILRILDRVHSATLIDSIILATSDLAADDDLAALVARQGVAVFRGSSDDVLGRFHAAALTHHADIVIRINGDNPLVDGRFCDPLIEAIDESEIDYVSYRVAGRPAMLTGIGFFAEAMTSKCLDRAHREIRDSFLREHVTLGIYRDATRYRVKWLECPEYCDDLRLRFTVDTREDLALMEEISHELGDEITTASAKQVVEHVMNRVDWIQRMHVANNAHPKRRESGETDNG